MKFYSESKQMSKQERYFIRPFAEAVRKGSRMCVGCVWGKGMLGRGAWAMCTRQRPSSAASRARARGGGEAQRRGGAES